MKTKRDFEIVLAGREPVPAVNALGSRDHVRIVPSPDDMVPWFEKATAVIVPVRQGSGTRIKILEAYNHGRPVVSTTLGAHGLEFCDGKQIFLRDDPAGFAHACSALVDDLALGRAMAEEGWRRVQEGFIWESFLPNVERVLDAALRHARS